MTASVCIVMLLLTFAHTHADYALGPINTQDCPTGYLAILTESDCEAAKVFIGAVDFTTSSTSQFPSACSRRATDLGFFVWWNMDSVGGTSVKSEPLCKAPPTPTPTPAPTSAPTPAPTSASTGGMFGDPIVLIHGHRIKFQMPVHEKSLMWADDTIDVLAAADLMTPDKKSQWFSDFILLANKMKVAHIQRREITLPATGDADDDAKSLSVAFLSQDITTARTKLGTYDLGNGAFRLKLQRGAQMIGPMRKDVVQVNGTSISFSLSPERAQKFSDDLKAMKYVHLDLRIHSMQKTVKAGMLAELYGFVPMSAKTVSLISSVHM